MPRASFLVRVDGENLSAGANVEMFLSRDEPAARELIEDREWAAFSTSTPGDAPAPS
jgi:hypothetical protein